MNIMLIRQSIASKRGKTVLDT